MISGITCILCKTKVVLVKHGKVTLMYFQSLRDPALLTERRNQFSIKGSCGGDAGGGGSGVGICGGIGGGIDSVGGCAGGANDGVTNSGIGTWGSVLEGSCSRRRNPVSMKGSCVGGDSAGGGDVGIGGGIDGGGGGNGGAGGANDGGSDTGGSVVVLEVATDGVGVMVVLNIVGVQSIG